MKANSELETLIDLMAKLPGPGPAFGQTCSAASCTKTGAADGAACRRHGARCRDDARVPELRQFRDGRALRHLHEREARERRALRGRGTWADLWAMERAGVFKGRYHVLGGTLSALDAVGPEELRIPALVERVAEERIREVILALNATVEGQTTAHYVADQLEGRVTVTSLAQGVPIGGELDYLDDGTIGAALRARKSL